MNNYHFAVLLSVFVLIPLAGWKITGMVKKLQRMSKRGKEERKGLTPHKKNLSSF